MRTYRDRPPKTRSPTVSGYADSSPVIPTKRGVVTDAKTVLAHVSKYANGSAPVIVWGHSLGTAVASQSLSDLVQEGHAMPKALVLESPFNNIRDEVCPHFCQVLNYRNLCGINFADPRTPNDLSVAKNAVVRLVLHGIFGQVRRCIFHGRMH